MIARFRKILLFIVALMLSFAGSVSAYAIPQLLVDMNNGKVLYAQDAGKKWHPASLTKLMTAFVTYEAIKAGRVSLDSVVTMSRRSKQAPPSVSSLRVEESVSLENALYLLLVKSANDVAIAIAETVSGSHDRFVADMNATARRLGMSASHFANPNGLHDDAQYVSARDMAVLVMNMRGRFPQYNKIYKVRTIEYGPEKLRQRSYNIMLTQFSGATGMKTGYVCASGYNMVASANRGGRQLLSVVMGAGNGRERSQLNGYLLSQGYAGVLSGTGLLVDQVRNDLASPPPNLRPQICGGQREAYQAARLAVFKGGVKGQTDYLSDRIEPRRYPVFSLGRYLNIVLPRARPAYAYIKPKISPIAAALLPPLPRRRAAQDPLPLPPLPRLRPALF